MPKKGKKTKAVAYVSDEEVTHKKRNKQQEDEEYDDSEPKAKISSNKVKSSSIAKKKRRISNEGESSDEFENGSTPEPIKITVSKASPKKTPTKSKESPKKISTQSTPATKKSPFSSPGGLFSKLLTKDDMDVIPMFSPSKVETEAPNKAMKKWNPDRCSPFIEISDDGSTATYVPSKNSKNSRTGVIALVQAGAPLNKSHKEKKKKPKVSYFEVTIKDPGSDPVCKISVGIAPVSHSLSEVLGSQADGCGYAANGRAWIGNLDNGIPFAETYGESGDVIGCGLLLQTGKIFFTKNGRYEGVAATINLASPYSLYPTVQLHSPGQTVEINWNSGKFQFDARKKHFKRISPRTFNTIQRESILQHYHQLTGFEDLKGGLFSEGIPVPLKGVTGRVTIMAAMAEVEVTQEYYNYQNQSIDGHFIFPLEDQATVTGFRVDFSDGSLVAKVTANSDEEKEENGKGFEKSPDVNSFQAIIENIPPNRYIKISISYVTYLRMISNELKFVLPATVCPHYAYSWSNEVYDLDAPDPLPFDQYGVSFQILITQPSLILSIQSSKTSRNFNRHDQVFTVTEQFVSDRLLRDYVLSISIHQPFLPHGLLENDYVKKSAVCMAMLSPYTKSAVRVHEEFIFLVDRSKDVDIEMIQHGLRVGLHSLPLECKFRVVSFGSKIEDLINNDNKSDESESESDEYGTMLYTNESLEKAISELSSSKFKKHLGKRSLEKALKSVLLSPLDIRYSQASQSQDNDESDLPRRQRNIILILNSDDDEDISGGDINEIDEMIRDKCDDNQRIFVIATKESLKYVASRISRTGRGCSEIAIKSKRDLGALIVNQLERAIRPCLYNNKITWNQMHSSFTKQVPDDIPTIFSGDTHLLFGFFETVPLVTKLYHEANTDTGESLSDQIELSISIEGDLIHKFAAIAEIDQLELKYFYTNDSSLLSSIQSLSIDYKILTHHSSFIIESDSKLPQLKKNMRTARVALVPRVTSQEKPKKDMLRGSLSIEEEGGVNIDEMYDKIVSLQNANGSWSLTNEFARSLNLDYKSLCNFKPKSCLSKSKDHDTSEILATSIGMSFLKECVFDKYAEWRGIFRKARRFISEYSLHTPSDRVQVT